MKKYLWIFLFVFLSGSSFSQTTQLTSFKSLFESLKSGEDVNAVIQYAKCNLLIDRKETQTPDAIGGMKLLP